MFYRSEPGYWVGKVSLRSWRRLASENLENGLLDFNCIELLNDGNPSSKIPSYKYEDSESTEKEEFHHTETSNDGNYKTNENLNKCSGDYRAVNGNFSEDMEVDPVESDQTAVSHSASKKINLDAKLPPHIFAKLEECYSLSAHSNIDNMQQLNKLLKEVIDFIKNLEAAPYEFVSSGDMKSDAIIKEEPHNENKTRISSYLSAFDNFLQNRDKTLKVNDSPMEEVNCRKFIESTATNEDQDTEIATSINETSVHIRHSNCDAKPIVCNSVNTVPDIVIDNKILLNGDAVPYKPKSIDNEDESSSSETRFNEDLLCQHG